MKEVELTKGYVCLVDDEDYELVSLKSWHIKPSRGGRYKAHTIYACTAIRLGHGRKAKVAHVSMHRFLMNAAAGQLVDHINGNGLDNRRHNLRFCTRSQNRTNQWHGLTERRGARFHKRLGLWQSSITVNGKQIHISYFKTPEEASAAYDAKAILLHGEYATTSTLSQTRIECPSEYGVAHAV